MKRELTDVQAYIVDRLHNAGGWHKTRHLPKKYAQQARSAKESWEAGRGIIMAPPGELSPEDAAAFEVLIDLANFQATRSRKQGAPK